MDVWTENGRSVRKGEMGVNTEDTWLPDQISA